MHEQNVLLQEDLTDTAEDTAQPGRGTHWAFYVAAIGLGLMIFLIALLAIIYLIPG